jgi:hypothetical protein
MGVVTEKMDQPSFMQMVLSVGLSMASCIVRMDRLSWHLMDQVITVFVVGITLMRLG